MAFNVNVNGSTYLFIYEINGPRTFIILYNRHFTIAGRFGTPPWRDALLRIIIKCLPVAAGVT